MVYGVFEVMVRSDASKAALEDYATYRAAVPPLVTRFGGRYLVRAANASVLEGPEVPGEQRWHLIEFPDAAAARAFWSCPEYLAVKHLRDGAVDVRAVLLEP